MQSRGMWCPSNYPEQWQVTVHQLEERVETLKRLWAVLPFFAAGISTSLFAICLVWSTIAIWHGRCTPRRHWSQTVQVVKRTRLKSVKFLKFTLQACQKAQLHTITSVQYLWPVIGYWVIHININYLCARLGGLIYFSTSGRISSFFQVQDAMPSNQSPKEKQHFISCMEKHIIKNTFETLKKNRIITTIEIPTIYLNITFVVYI